MARAKRAKKKTKTVAKKQPRKTVKKKSAPKPAKAAKAATKKGPSARALQAVDPERVKRYDELIAEIEDADRAEKGGWDRKYEAVGEILEGSLFLLTPHGTAQEWCKEILGETYRNASRNARVAKYFSPDDETRYSVPRLEAYIAYVEAKTGGPIKGSLKLDLEKTRIPIVRDGKTKRLPLIEIQPAELFAAARLDVSENAKARARRSPIESAFASALHEEKALADVTVRFSDGTISLGRIPMSHLDVALKILRGVDWQSELPK